MVCIRSLYSPVRLLALAMLATPLAACVTANGGVPAPVVVTQTQAADLISQVQQATVAACRFLPAANFIQNLYFQNQNTAVNSAAQVAAAICGAVAQQPVAVASVRAGSRAPPTLGGVKVEGRYLRPG